MFGLFKKRFNNLPIKEAIEDCRRRGATNLTINVYNEDVILFQVMDAKYFYKMGLIEDQDKGVALLHFFHKEKPWADETWAEFKNKHEERGYYSFEDPKGVFNFVKNISSESNVIQQEILNSIDYYKIKHKSNISIDYLEFN